MLSKCRFWYDDELAECRPAIMLCQEIWRSRNCKREVRYRDELVVLLKLLAFESVLPFELLKVGA